MIQNSKFMIHNSIIKIICLLLIIGLNWFGLLTVNKTFAYFNDTENSFGNVLSVSKLDFYLEEIGDFSLNFSQSKPAKRKINLLSESGSLPFKYKIKATDFEGPLCEKLNLEAKLDGTTKYLGTLMDFILSVPVDFSEPSDNWEFIISFSGDIETYKNKPCQFYFQFFGWQNDLEESGGFSDQENSFLHLSLRDDRVIVLNEFVADPCGNDCQLQGLEGEWVELYNNSDGPIDLEGWYLEDEASHRIYVSTSTTLTGSTIIGPKGSNSEWLVILLNDCILNNDTDTVKLFNPQHELIDSYYYNGTFEEGKSFARWPDGTGPWYDPIPTPGGPNLLKENLLDNILPQNLDLDEISNSQATATATTVPIPNINSSSTIFATTTSELLSSTTLNLSTTSFNLPTSTQISIPTSTTSILTTSTPVNNPFPSDTYLISTTSTLLLEPLDLELSNSTSSTDTSASSSLSSSTSTLLSISPPTSTLTLNPTSTPTSTSIPLPTSTPTSTLSSGSSLTSQTSSLSETSPLEETLEETAENIIRCKECGHGQWY